jgi:hypothetical protein
LLVTLALAALLVSAACAPEALEVFPAAVTLEGPRDRQALVARRVDEAGLSTDRSDAVALRVADPRVARVDGRAVLPVADGETVVVVAVDGVERSIPVRVVGAAAPISPPSLRLDVLPVFSHAGCNAGGCHGSSRGQDGFRLSLFGFDPDTDHRSIVSELPGRRVDLAEPARSLLLTKATGAVAHTGGERFKPDDPRYDTLRRWIEAGGAERRAGRSACRRDRDRAAGSRPCMRHDAADGRAGALFRRHGPRRHRARDDVVEQRLRRHDRRGRRRLRVAPRGDPRAGATRRLHGRRRGDRGRRRRADSPSRGARGRTGLDRGIPCDRCGRR